MRLHSGSVAEEPGSEEGGVAGNVAERSALVLGGGGGDRVVGEVRECDAVAS